VTFLLSILCRLDTAATILNVGHVDSLQEYGAGRDFLKMLYKSKSTTHIRALQSIYVEQYITSGNSEFVITQKMSLTTLRAVPLWIYLHPCFAYADPIGPDGHAVRGHLPSRLDLYMQAKQQKQFALCWWRQLELDVLEAVGLTHSDKEFAFSEQSAVNYLVAGHKISFSRRRTAQQGAKALFAEIARLLNKSGWHKRQSWSMWQSCAVELGLHATDFADGQEWSQTLQEALIELLMAREGCMLGIAVFPVVRTDSDGGRTIKKNQWSKYYI